MTTKYTKDYTDRYSHKKNEIIGKIYNDLSGFGSARETLLNARKLNKHITREDVLKWKEDNIQRKVQLPGKNSFIANRPKQEYQMDLMFLSDLNFKQDDYTYVGGMLAVDIFTKFCSVVLLKSKNTPDLLQALKETWTKMHGKPDSIYTDAEGGITSKEVQAYLQEQGIKFIRTANHAAYAERTIRTVKDMLHKREEAYPDTKWYDMLEPVLKAYNGNKQSSITKMTPDEATKPENHLNVKLNLELHRKHSRTYPAVKVGDKVRIYRKKRLGEKEDVSQWSNAIHSVENISHWGGQDFYKVSDKAIPYTRADILQLSPENTLEEKPYRERQHREKRDDEDEEEEPGPAPNHQEPPAAVPAQTVGSLIKKSIATYVKKTAEEKAANLAAAKARKEEMKSIMAKHAK